MIWHWIGCQNLDMAEVCYGGRGYVREDATGEDTDGGGNDGDGGNIFIIVDSLPVKSVQKKHLFTCFVTHDIQLWIQLNVSIKK